MSALEQRELQELGMTPEQLKAKQQELASVTAPQASDPPRRLYADGEFVGRSNDHITSLGICPECKHDTQFLNRNRLANCGHVRRSHGKLVRVGENPPKPEGRIITVRFNVTTEKQAQTYAKALRVFLDAGDTANVDAMLTAAVRG